MTSFGRFYQRINSAPDWIRNSTHYLRNSWENANERLYNIATTPDNQQKIHMKPLERLAFNKSLYLSEDEVGGRKYEDNNPYGVGDYYYLRKIRRLVDLKADDVVYDIGCGMGRVLCVFARKNIQRCIGIELSRELCDISEINTRQMRGNHCEIEVICEDATSTDLSDGTVFVLFNPFGEETMKEFLANVKKTLKSNPRHVRLAYYNDQHRDLFQMQDWLRETKKFSTLNGLHVSIWETSTKLGSKS